MKSPQHRITGSWVTFLVVICFGCGSKDSENQNPRTSPARADPAFQRDYESESYAVLSALIRDMYLDKPLLVIQASDPCPPAKGDESSDQKVEELRQQTEYAFKGMPQLALQTIDDFYARARECHSLQRKLNIPGEYVLVGSKDLEALFPQGGLDRVWSRFYAKYPGSSGIINFSNPGFNQDFTQALISTGRVCGGLCGAGSLVLLKKEQGAWRVETKIGTWVS